MGDTPYGKNASECEVNLVPDFMVSMAPRVRDLLNAGIPTLVYVGQLDIIIGTPLVLSWVNALQWDGADEYAKNKRGVWRARRLDPSDPQQGNDPVFGYFRQAQSLTTVTVRGAGHILPADQPIQALDMITRFIEGIPFDRDASVPPYVAMQ